MNTQTKLKATLTAVQSSIFKKERELLAGVGITPTQLSVLTIINASPGISTMDIRKSMDSELSDTSRIVDRMVVHGLVTKNIDPKDKRKVNVALTFKGKKALRIGTEHSKDLFKGIDEAQMEAVILVLEQLK